MQNAFKIIAAFTLVAGMISVCASDQNDAQPEQLTQEEVANLTLVAESIAYGIGTGLASGILAGLFIDSFHTPRFAWETVPLYTYLYSRYRKCTIDEKSLMIDITHVLGFASGHVAGLVAGAVTRAVIEVVLKQLVNELQLKWNAATSSK